MLLAGDTKVGDVETVKLLEPPAGSQVGDLVSLQHHSLTTSSSSSSSSSSSVPSSVSSSVSSHAAQMNKKQWDRVLANLRAQDSKVCYAGIPLATHRGPIACPTLPDGSLIH
eukprot:c3183_g1_i2.p2 GENE.c3183_g1_i2~~c3183_g1_i2.p2  ORF type:complete len:112 (+),score=24.79 c3183_g1_i2:309-644(+)